MVEVPVYWALDDWPQFEPGPSRDGLAPPSKVLEIWLGELDYAWRHAPGGLLTVTMHPECIGRGHRMAMLESFIDAAAALDGVVFDRLIGSSPAGCQPAAEQWCSDAPLAETFSPSAVSGIRTAGAQAGP